MSAVQKLKDNVRPGFSVWFYETHEYTTGPYYRVKLGAGSQRDFVSSVSLEKAAEKALAYCCKNGWIEDPEQVLRQAMADCKLVDLNLSGKGSTYRAGWFSDDTYLMIRERNSPDALLKALRDEGVL